MDPGYDMSLDDLLQWNISIVNDFRSERLLGGYTDSNQITWDTTADAIQNLSGVCTLIACGAVTGTQVWRDAINVNHNMSPTDLVTLAGGIAYYVRQCYVASWTHKAAMQACTDIATLLNYDMTTNWP